MFVHSLEYKYDEPEFNRTKLRLFERLLADNRRTVAAVSTVDPSSFRFGTPDANLSDENARKSELEQRRWLEIFDSFVRDYGTGSQAPLASEALETQLSDPSATPNTEYLYIRNYCHYRSLWASCSRDEQLAL